MDHLDTYIDILKKASFTKKDKSVEKDLWLNEILELLLALKKAGKRLFFIGNGASCSMASHFASDFTKNGGIDSYSNNDGALLTCFSNDFSFEDSYAEILKRKMNEGDCLIAISSSGRSKNIINAVKEVKSNIKESTVITLSGISSDNPLYQSGDYNLYLNTKEYGFIESGHNYFLHLMIDILIEYNNKNGN